jgi:putative PIN family toxin of toxin-antitoxin system
MRVVLDTDVMVAAIRSDQGASRQLLIQGLTGKIEFLVSVPLVVEYEAVMTRPEHLAASGLAAADVGALLDAMVSVATPVRLAFLWRPVLHDSDDDMVLETAINGGADGLVTFNLRDFAIARNYGVAVFRPSEMLARWETES